jgi:hypothetical protein
VWATNDPTTSQVFQFPCFMYAAVFSALNPNILVCGGIQSGAILFDIKAETKDFRPFYCQIDKLSSHRACIDGSAATTESTSAAVKSNKRNRQNRGGGDNGVNTTEEATPQDVILGADEARPALVEAEQQTMLYLCSKELNREPLNVLKRCIEQRTENEEADVRRMMFNEQFFSSRECLRTLLVTERKSFTVQFDVEHVGRILNFDMPGVLNSAFWSSSYYWDAVFGK